MLLNDVILRFGMIQPVATHLTICGQDKLDLRTQNWVSREVGRHVGS